ncbi:hypothetical protein Galf_1838 [Gallionella capsiferriformans ES-2]|uniref:Uncharacterized protein n=1 Tax=Gallionella capsiferriformans (strain ES-2) TaxID=395494 RepID=D9SH51_GALCS|nr:hypothetical protein Galf_1838 [Gallionella capsiferriformans ES-2]
MQTQYTRTEIFDLLSAVKTSALRLSDSDFWMRR